MILDSNHYNPSVVALDESAERLLTQIAYEMGMLGTEAEADALARLTEAATLNEDQNVVRLNRQAKLDGLTVRTALVIAQQKKDPIFAKYSKAAHAKRLLRDLIVKKYGAQAGSTARKILANAGKRGMVDLPTRPSTFSHPESR